MSLNQPQLTFIDTPATLPVSISDPKFEEALAKVMACQNKEELYKSAKSYCNWYERNFTRGRKGPGKKGVPA